MLKKFQVDQLLNSIIDYNPELSDINLTVGRPIQAEVYGKLVPVPTKPHISHLTPYQTEAFALALIGSNQKLLKDLFERKYCDLSYPLGDRVRFRVNIFSQQGNYSIVMRKLDNRVPTIEEMGLPPVFKEIAREQNGIVLFTGATGTGKTTSLAAILDAINKELPVHIITLEDPIEYIHKPIKATFNQRELGLDFDNFAEGLRASLRQAPKVILVGEMRDRETIEIAIQAAETGHLVFSTLHTIDAGTTVNRILSYFRKEEEHLIRNQLAEVLKWVVCQRLLPTLTGTRVAVFEIMRTNLRIKDLIINGESEDRSFYEVIKDGSAFKMQTFDQDILRIYKKNIISEQVALAYASRRTEVKRGIDAIKSELGIKTTEIEGLTLESQEMEW